MSNVELSNIPSDRILSKKESDQILIRNDDLLDEWKIKFSKLRKNHINAAIYYSRLNNVIGCITIILSATGSVLSSVFASNENNLDKTTGYILIGIFHWLVLLFSGLNHFFNFKSKETTHLKSSHQFAELLRNIELQETYPNKNRDCDFILKKYNQITDQEPVISTCC